MNDYGELLYEGKTDGNKGGIVYLILGIGLIALANFIYMKEFMYVVGGILLLLSAYMFIFKRGEKISIYEKAIILLVKGKHYAIEKDQIATIEFHKVQMRKAIVPNYQAVIVLHNKEKLLLDKMFNSTAHKQFDQVIRSYVI